MTHDDIFTLPSSNLVSRFSDDTDLIAREASFAGSNERASRGPRGSWSFVANDVGAGHNFLSTSNSGPITPVRIGRVAFDAPRKGDSTGVNTFQSDSPTAGLLDVVTLYNQVTEAGTLRAYSFCANRPALSAPVRFPSEADLQMISHAESTDNFSIYDEPRVVACLVCDGAPAVEPTVVSQYYVKGYDVAHSDEGFDVLILLMRQMTYGFAGGTSMASIKSAWLDRRLLVMEYITAALRPGRNISEKLMTSLMAMYGGAVPFRALHKNTDGTVRVREIILDNTVGWFFSHEHSVTAYLDLVRTLATEYSKTHLGMSIPSSMDRSTAGAVALPFSNAVRQSGYGSSLMKFVFESSYQRKMLLYTSAASGSADTVSFCGDAFELEVVSQHNFRRYGHLAYLFPSGPGPVVFASGRVSLTEVYFSSVVGYEALRTDDSWDVNVVILCTLMRRETSFESSWMERRMSYMHYVSDAGEARQLGGVDAVIRRDRSIKVCHEMYSSALPVLEMAASSQSPVVFRECLLLVDDIAYGNYATINSFVSDLRSLVFRSI